MPIGRLTPLPPSTQPSTDPRRSSLGIKLGRFRAVQIQTASLLQTLDEGSPQPESAPEKIQAIVQELQGAIDRSLSSPSGLVTETSGVPTRSLKVRGKDSAVSSAKQWIKIAEILAPLLEKLLNILLAAKNGSNNPPITSETDSAGETKSLKGKDSTVSSVKQWIKIAEILVPLIEKLMTILLAAKTGSTISPQTTPSE